MPDRDLEIARSVLKLANKITSDRNKRLKGWGLTSEQADSLQFFEGREDVTATDLKDYLGVTHQTAWGIVKRMADKGLVTLAVSPEDGRRRTVAITPQGREALSRMHANGARIGGRLTQGMTEAERLQFKALMDRVLENARRG